MQPIICAESVITVILHRVYSYKYVSRSVHTQRLSRNCLHCELASHRIAIAPAVTLQLFQHLRPN